MVLVQWAIHVGAIHVGAIHVARMPVQVANLVATPLRHVNIKRQRLAKNPAPERQLGLAAVAN